MFKAAEKTRAKKKNVCLWPALPRATYIRVCADTGCPAQTQDQDLCLVEMMTETMWEPQAKAYDAGQEGKPSGMWRLVLSQWCDGPLGCFSACG